ncbi:hypothetical protein NIES4074_33840 [Cylindrospermum sp. NIES-4074]|nr:hypothetical protein NIES4074_33840 [Cylindrospermum sp. NIES-4074]
MFPQASRNKPIKRYHRGFTSPTAPSQGNFKYVFSLIFLVFLVTPLSAASAHTVKIAADVGATLHIEPNDNPRAGETSLAWFALTRKGGKTIPLKDCNCQLVVYAEPHSPGEPALIEPPLKPVAVERYQGTPGAEIIFPKPGAYQLQLNGKPATGTSFKPFELKFTVTVATGTPVNAPPDVENVSQGTQGVTGNLAQPLIILGIALLSIGFIFFLVQAMRRS